MNLRGFAFLLTVVILAGAVAPFAVDGAVAQTNTPAGSSTSGAGSTPPSIPAESNAVCRGDATRTVSSLSGLKNALQTASAGETVLVTPDSTIRMGESRVVVPSGVTLAGGRGCGGSKGAKLVSEYRGRMPAMIDTREGARVTGLRVYGPFRGTTENPPSEVHDHARKGVRAVSATVDHVAVRGWSWAGVNLRGDSKIVESVVTDTRYDGLGYGVVVGEGNGDIRGVRFERNRHAVAGVGGPDSSYRVTNSVFGGGMMSHVVDMHGQGQNGMGGVAGGRIVLTNNTWSEPTEHSAIFIRGEPANGALIRGNTFAYKGQGQAFSQTGGVSENVRLVSNEYTGGGPVDAVADAATGAVDSVAGFGSSAVGATGGVGQAVGQIGNALGDPLGWAKRTIFMPVAESAGDIVNKYAQATVGITSACNGELGRECFVPDPNATPVWFLAFVFYYGTYGTVGLMKASADGVQWARADFAEQNDVLKEKVWSHVKLIFGWPAMQITYLFVGAAITLLLPDGTEFFLSTENFAKLSLGAGLGIAALATNTVVTLAAVFYGWAMQELLKIVTGLVVIGLLVHRTDLKTAHYWGGAVLAMPALIIAVRLTQAVLLWFAFYMPVGTLSAESLKSTLFIVFLLWIVFITTPRTARHSILPEAAMMASTRIEGKVEQKENELRAQVDGNLTAKLEEEVTNLRERVVDSRTGEDFSDRSYSTSNGWDYGPSENSGSRSGEEFDHDDDNSKW